jgi:hypothetical protein
MNVFAYGAEKVREIERALGGPPPKSVLKESLASLQRYAAERSKQQQAAFAEVSRRSELRRELLLNNLSKDDPRLKKLKEQRQALMKKRPTPRKIERLKPPKIEAMIGSNFGVALPPYYSFDGWKTCQGDSAKTDPSSGSCILEVDSFGEGYCAVHAMFPVLFYTQEDNPMQRVAVRVDYSYDWFDIADFYTGQIDFGTQVFVWRMEGPVALVWQANLSPSWSDHANWLDDNEDSQQGSTLAETYFQAEANHNYMVQVEFDASVNADSGRYGSAWCHVHLECTVPMVVFGSLF